MLSISIHALREEGDRTIYARIDPNTRISIHALREEGDVIILAIIFGWGTFLSTPSARRAT